jgi:hypothetical protein
MTEARQTVCPTPHKAAVFGFAESPCKRGGPLTFRILKFTQDVIPSQRAATALRSVDEI